MLKRKQALVHFDEQRRVAVPDRLRRKQHADYLGYAQRMLRIYETGNGCTRRELHRRVEAVFEHVLHCPPRRIEAFQKLLDDASEYQTNRAAGAAQLRQQVFSRAANYHPLVSHPEGVFCNSEQGIKSKIAAELNRSWNEIDADLFSDVIEFQRLKAFPGFASAAALLARYNVAQVQAVLYDAVTMIVWSRRDHKDILRYAKLARLMHTIVRETNGTYRFTLDGPASVLRTSKRYGVALARFLTGLLACREWSAVAQLQGKYGRRYRLDLSSDDGLQSAVMPSAEFDSQLEADFFRAWDPEKLDGWKLERESEILHSGQHVFTPDFVLISPQGRRILLEIVGFWTPEYLQAKLATIRQFAKHEVLVAVAEEAQFDLPDWQPPPLTFKRQLKPAKVLEHIATYA